MSGEGKVEGSRLGTTVFGRRRPRVRAYGVGGSSVAAIPSSLVDTLR